MSNLNTLKIVLICMILATGLFACGGSSGGGGNGGAGSDSGGGDGSDCTSCLNLCHTSYLTCTSDCYKAAYPEMCRQNCSSEKASCESRWCSGCK
jgi:hypothetical protein